MKKAVELRNDESMIATIGNESLIAKEFKKYYHCCKDYTQIVIMHIRKGWLQGSLLNK